MKRIVNIYISLFLLYFLQGSLYESGGVIGRLLLVFVILFSLYFWVYAMMRMKLPKPLKILSFLVVVWTIYGIEPILFGVGDLAVSIPSFYVLKKQYTSLLPIFTFYVFVKNGWLTEAMVKKWTFVFIIVAVASFFAYQNKILQDALERGSRREEFTNNAGYIVLSVIPLLPLFWEKPTLQYTMLGICIWFVLIAYKRGAIAIGIISSLWLIYHSFKVNISQEKITLRQQIVRLVLTVVIIVGAIYAIRTMMSSSSYFVERLERTLEGDSSGRDSIYSRFFNHFINETNVIRFLFGNGAFGTLKFGSNFAHNDWLEIAIDNGLVLIIVYAIYWISLFVMFFKGKRNSPTTLMFGTFVIIYFSKTLFSMSYNEVSPYAACAFGYALAKFDFQDKKLV